MHFDNYVYFQLRFHVAVNEIYCIDIKKIFNFHPFFSLFHKIIETEKKIKTVYHEGIAFK